MCIEVKMKTSEHQQWQQDQNTNAEWLLAFAPVSSFSSQTEHWLTSFSDAGYVYTGTN